MCDGKAGAATKKAVVAMQQNRVFTLSPFKFGSSGSSASKIASTPTEFIQRYFAIAYHLFFVPYKFVRVADGSFEFQTSALHQVICAANHLLILYRISIERYAAYLARQYYKGIEDTVKARAYVSIVFVTSAIEAIYKLVFLYTIWGRRRGFLYLINEIDGNPGNEQHKPRKSIRRISLLLSLICILVPLINNISVNIRPKRDGTYEYLFLVKRIAGQLKNLFFAHSPPEWLEGQELEVTGLDYLLAAIQLLTMFQRVLFLVYSDALNLVGTLTFLYASKQLMDRLSSGKEQALLGDEVLQEYRRQKTIADKISAQFGGLMVMYAFQGMGTIALALEEMSGSAKWIFYIAFTTNTGIYFSTMFVAASATRKISTLQDWLMLDGKSQLFSLPNLVLISKELQSHRIGISPCGLFTITYGLIATIVGFILTQSLLILQLKP